MWVYTSSYHRNITKKFIGDQELCHSRIRWFVIKFSKISSHHTPSAIFFRIAVMYTNELISYALKGSNYFNDWEYNTISLFINLSHCTITAAVISFDKQNLMALQRQGEFCTIIKPQTHRPQTLMSRNHTTRNPEMISPRPPHMCWAGWGAQCRSCSLNKFHAIFYINAWSYMS